MTRDRIFRDTASRASGFVFDDAVAEAFDDMVARSVPFDLEQQHMIAEIARTFWTLGTVVYDLGCSTGTTLIGICRALEGPAQLVGYDNSRPLLERAARKIREQGLETRIELREADLNGDLSALALAQALSGGPMPPFPKPTADYDYTSVRTTSDRPQ